jgi:hypothetical protein
VVLVGIACENRAEIQLERRTDKWHPNPLLYSILGRLCSLLDNSKSELRCKIGEAVEGTSTLGMELRGLCLDQGLFGSRERWVGSCRCFRGGLS